jgi:hypothetical protein
MEVLILQWLGEGALVPDGSQIIFPPRVALDKRELPHQGLGPSLGLLHPMAVKIHKGLQCDS